MSPAARNSDGGETSTCPWCSATVPAEASTCPSCGASLRDAAEGDILGVTQIDPAAVARARRSPSPRDIAAFLGVGDAPAEDDPIGRVEPPSDEVRQEMLRLELAALDAEIEAKSKEAAAQQALPLDDDAKAKPA